MPRFALRFVLAASVVLTPTLCPAVHATWSIVIADRATREVAVGTVTCLRDLDLLAIVPVVVIGKGAGACQSFGDFEGIRRPVIADGLINGDSPAAIMSQLAIISGHQGRQYGIADTLGRTVTFSGSQCGSWADGTTGAQGTIVFAVQGNVLAGQCVVDAIRDALIETRGGIPEKLMAGMEAARDAGGDGRCSCQTGTTNCGCPVPAFSKCGHIGGMVVARLGDQDDPECAASGCADGKYYMRLNAAFQTVADPDPVDQLRVKFDAWRASLRGQPDHIRSYVTFDPPSLPADGRSRTRMRIELRDWRGAPVSLAGRRIIVTHAEGSAGLATISRNETSNTASVEFGLTAGQQAGVDRFDVRIEHAPNPVILMPQPVLVHSPLASGGQRPAPAARVRPTAASAD